MSGGIVTVDDYMDEDVAYLLGMLFGRGQLIEVGDVRRLVIDVEIRRSLPKLPAGVISPDINLDLENERALNKARTQINNLLDANVDVSFSKPKNKQKHTATLYAVFVKRTIAWRDLKVLTSDGTDRGNFALPKAFFGFPATIHAEFVRGFADVAVMPSAADALPTGKQRVAFPVVHDNLAFAKQLKQLLERLNCPAPLLPGTVKKRGSPKEHRIRPYADDYESIGFHFSHKQRLLELLADYNRSLKTKKKSARKKST